MNEELETFCSDLSPYLHSSPSPRQRHTPNEQNEENNVREDGGEVGYFPWALDALDKGKENKDPGTKETER